MVDQAGGDRIREHVDQLVEGIVREPGTIWRGSDQDQTRALRPLDSLRSLGAQGRLAAELLCRAAGLPVDPDGAATARAVAQTFAQLRPPEYRADLVVEVGAPCTELAIVVEIQLTPDKAKQGSWPQYVAALWGRLRCPVWLLVVAVDGAVAEWCTQTIEMGGMRLQPVVVGPKDIPSVTDPRAARAAPELAVPSRRLRSSTPRVNRCALRVRVVPMAGICVHLCSSVVSPSCPDPGSCNPPGVNAGIDR
ncbi:MAG: hypothetical protein HY907_00120 [Deltaproteobacteria bacterium]|nr:hypothetical protein [Deltaproteobacteria bacterium]